MSRFFIYFLLLVPLVAWTPLALADDFVALSGIPAIESNATNLPALFNSLLAFTIGAAALLAVLMLAIGGIEYMGSDVWSSKQEGKDRMKDAVFGLILILASWLILSILNPNLLEIDSITSVGGRVGGGVGQGAATCSQVDLNSCRSAICVQTCNH